jgi:hypothetical protein
MNAHELILLRIGDDVSRAVTHGRLHESLAQRVISFAGALSPVFLDKSVIAGGSDEWNMAWLRWSTTATGQGAVVEFWANGHTTIALVHKGTAVYRDVPSDDADAVCGALLQVMAQMYSLVTSGKTAVDTDALYWRQPRKEEVRRPLTFDWSSDGDDLF